MSRLLPTKPPMVSPTFEFEKKLWQQGYSRIIGIDEVGRGALAGPVVVGVVSFEPTHQPIEGVRDSKQLTATQRYQLAQSIQEQATYWQVGQASSQEIDTYGIVPATMMAITRALSLLPTFDHALMDGKPFTTQNIKSVGEWPTQPFSYIVKGDQLSYSIAAASIIAKVFRDQLMQEVASSFSNYDWKKNVGYGTASHRRAIQVHGLTTYHRKSFCRNALLNSLQ
jgi:ribonuclease HII